MNKRHGNGASRLTAVDLTKLGPSWNTQTKTCCYGYPSYHIHQSSLSDYFSKLSNASSCEQYYCNIVSVIWLGALCTCDQNIMQVCVCNLIGYFVCMWSNTTRQGNSGEKVIYYQLELGKYVGRTSSLSTGAFNQNVSKLFTKLKLVTDNLFIYAEANWEATEIKCNFKGVL